MATVETQLQDKPRPSRGRRLVRALIGTLLLLVVIVLVFPYAMSIAVVRNSVFAVALRNVHGHVTADTFRCGWFSPPVIENFAIRTYAGEPVVAVERLTLEHSPWEMICQPSVIGKIEIEHPSVELLVREGGGSNFAEVFQGPRQGGLPARLRQESVQVIVHNAEFRWKLAKSDHDWGVGGMQVAARLEPEWMTADGEARLVIDPVTVVNHAELTREMCDDLLKYIVPELREFKVHGAGSLILAGGAIPLDEARDLDLAGVLVLHDVEAGPSPMIQGITSKLGVADEIALARNVEVKFAIAQQRVHHEGMELGTGELRIRTSGDVAFDQTLNLLAEVHVDLSDSTVEKRPALAALDNRSLKLPITGTIDKPQIEWRSIGGDLVQQFGDVLRGSGDAGTVQNLVQGLINQSTKGEPGAKGEPGSKDSTATDVTGAALDLLKQIRDRRQDRKESEAAAAPNKGTATPDAAEPPAAPRRPLLDRLRERREDRDSETTPPPATEKP